MYPVQGCHQHLSLLRWTRQVLTPFTCHGVSQNQKEVRIMQYPVEIDSVFIVVSLKSVLYDLFFKHIKFPLYSKFSL